MFRRWCRYLDKVFDFSGQVANLRDARRRPQIPTASVWLSVFLLFVFRHRSLNAMESKLHTGRFWRKLLGSRPPSADTMGRVFSLIDLESLRRCLIKWVQRLKRNKALDEGRIAGRIVAALDGHELFASFSRYCDACRHRLLSPGKRKQGYHRIVAASIIGARIHPVIDVESQQPGEGEIPCALRLFARLQACAPRLIGIFSLDALYASPIVINTLRAQGKHVVIVLKGNQPGLLRDAQGVFSLQKPYVYFAADNVHVQLWDAEGFTSLEGSQWPLRVVRCIETQTVRRRVAGKWTQETVRRQWYWLTTIPASEISGPNIRLIGHRRWEIENRGFNDLNTHWALDHCFKHTPNAILAFLLTLAMAHLLMSSFYHFNLKESQRRKLTTIALATTLYGELILHAASNPLPSMLVRIPP